MGLTSILSSSSPRARRERPARGFTLIELLVVLVIVGITLGIVTLNAMPGERQVLQNEAQRISLLFQLARDEAIVRNRPIAFEAQPEVYRFLLRDGNEWQVLSGDELLRERQFARSPVMLSISPSSAAAPSDMQTLRIVFGREPVDKPFVLTLASGDASVRIRADGIGHFVVE